MKQIALRFANPVIAGNIITYDVEATASENMKFFGMNLRFIYDSRMFKPANANNLNFKVIPEPGHITWNPFYGNSTTGGALFGWVGPMSYVNQAVQLNWSDKAISVPGDPTQWERLLRVSFTLVSASIPSPCCPILIWDRKPNITEKNQAGYMGQGEGVTVTEYLGLDSRNEFRSGPTIEFPNHLNWSANPAAMRYPWGVPIASECIQP